MSHKYDNLRILLHDACMLKAIEDLAEFPSDEEIAKIHEFSPAFKKRMAEMMEECFSCRNKDELAAARKRHLATIKKIAAAAAVSVAFTFSCAMSVEAIRDSFVKFVVRIYDDYLRVSGSSEKENNSNQVQLIKQYYEPSWIPQDYVETLRKKTTTKFYVEYQCNGRLINYSQIIKESADGLIADFDKENGIVYEEEGYGTYIFANGMHQLIWSDDFYYYVIRGEASKNDVLRMSKSLEAIETIPFSAEESSAIQEYYTIRWLPENFTLRESEEMPGYNFRKYVNGDQAFTFLQCKSVDYMTSALGDYDLGNYTVEEVPGVGRYQYAEGEDSLFSWKDDTYFYLITGNLSKDTLVALAESVQPE